MYIQVRFGPETGHELETIARERGVKKATIILIWVLEQGKFPMCKTPPTLSVIQKLQLALRGIYSFVEYPPLSSAPADPSEQYYTALNENS